MAAGRKAGSFGKADDSCRSFHWLAREGWRLWREWCLSTASCYFWSPMKANLTQKREHRWLQRKGDIQIVCWGQTGGCEAVKGAQAEKMAAVNKRPLLQLHEIWQPTALGCHDWFLQWTKSKYLQKSISEQVNYEWVAEQLHFALNTEIKF